MKNKNDITYRLVNVLCLTADSVSMYGALAQEPIPFFIGKAVALSCSIKSLVMTNKAMKEMDKTGRNFYANREEIGEKRMMANAVSTGVDVVSLLGAAGAFMHSETPHALWTSIIPASGNIVTMGTAIGNIAKGLPKPQDGMKPN